MASNTIFVLCTQALMIQCLFGQLNYAGANPAAYSSGVSSNVVTESTVTVSSTAAGVGKAGPGLTGVGWNHAAPLSTGVAGIGLNNVVPLRTGLAGVGLNNAGLLNSGVALGNTALIGNTIAPVISPEYITLASFSTGGLFPVTSFSSIVPTGITVVSDNIIDGSITVFGQLPFLSAVAFEGALPSDGASAAGCGCGITGNIGIISESYSPIAGPGVAAPVPAGLGVGAGIGLATGVATPRLGLGPSHGLGLNNGLGARLY
ncbi:chorion protein ERB.1-like [Galleria mellonella]|uniref:Chorion protein ERB.1-like n=1 Tax=Galleria mellonella TaxID=7137 RepID=A0ABM3MSR3_GALME|nr:chorion protein ERB.1-like [Galleria mellonella]